MTSAQPLLFPANDTTPVPRPRRRLDIYPRARRPYVRTPRSVLDPNGVEEEAALVELAVRTDLACRLVVDARGEARVDVLPTLWEGEATVRVVGKSPATEDDGAAWWCESFVAAGPRTLARRASAWLATFDDAHVRVARAEALEIDAEGRTVLRLRRDAAGAWCVASEAPRGVALPVVVVRAHAGCSELAHGA